MIISLSSRPASVVSPVVGVIADGSASGSVRGRCAALPAFRPVGARATDGCYPSRRSDGARMTQPALPASIDAAVALLAEGDYVAERSLATAVFLALRMKRPLFLEGEAGVGKTEIAKVLAGTLGRKLVRLQCYEGLDVASAVYEWNYSRQMIEIRLAEAEGTRDREAIAQDIFSERFLIRRPILQALEGDIAGAPVLLIDELDRTDEPFEAYLLEVLADFQVTIPEIGTVKADEPPIVVITSNRTREIHDALKGAASTTGSTIRPPHASSRF